MPKGASGVSDLRLHVGMQDTETFGVGLRTYACDSVRARPSHATVHVRGMFGALARQCQELSTQECFLHVFCLARSQNHQACEEDRAQSNELCKSTRKAPWTITAKCHKPMVWARRLMKCKGKEPAPTRWKVHAAACVRLKLRSLGLGNLSTNC